jgi:hypothetical protein
VASTEWEVSMGASMWHYFVPLRPNVRTAFRELQDQVLRDREYYEGVHKFVQFSSRSELIAARNVEAFWDVGTHSILDMELLVKAGSAPEPGLVIAQSPADTGRLMGSERPTKADFLRYYENLPGMPGPPWTGMVTVLFDDDEPHELVFWGASGD